MSFSGLEMVAVLGSCHSRQENFETTGAWLDSPAAGHHAPLESRRAPAPERVSRGLLDQLPETASGARSRCLSGCEDSRMFEANSIAKGSYQILVCKMMARTSPRRATDKRTN